MNVILLEDITNVGKLGDQIAVKAGFARNYLLPQGKAVIATPDNVAIFEERRAELEQRAAERLAEAQKRAQDGLADLTLTIAVRASDEGKLFGSLGPREIADALAKMGKSVEKSEVQMPAGPIRTVGEYTIDIYLHTDVTAKINVIVTAQE
jgi:large subunit ribosomal protein L9